jgi:hypothetical protein
LAIAAVKIVRPIFLVSYMIKKVCLPGIFFILISSITNGQSINIGLRFKSFAYSINHNQENTSGISFMPLPLSGYIKAGIIFYDKYEIELKTGYQLLSPFQGPEYALLFKYNIVQNIYPLFTYLNHFNAGDSRTGRGTYSNRMDFIGIGVEAKLVKLFNMDPTYYIPVGKRGLEYEVGQFSEYITTSEMGPMIKLGFHF